MSSPESTPSFLNRFEHVVRSHRRTTLIRTTLTALLTILLLFCALTALDYVLELPQSMRNWSAAAALVVAFAATIVLTRRALRTTSEQQVASAIESDFPELGQAVRTTVQFRKLQERSGASPSLVAAMHRDINERAIGLPLDHVVPIERLYRTAFALICIAAVIGTLAAASWQWRTASLRTLLAGQPYTEVEVAPDDAVVYEGDALRVAARVSGRVNRPTALWVRPASVDAPWTRRELSDVNVAHRSPRRVVYEIELPDIRDPIQYRVVAGNYGSSTHLANVRRPLEIESIEVRLEPPAYTGQSAQIVSEGSLNAVAGTVARFQFRLDRPAASANMKLMLERSADGLEATDQVIPLTVDGAELTAQLELKRDASYSIEAFAEDGSPIRKNLYRMRIHNDQPPWVAFRDGDPEMEVHSLAEVLLHARVEDDHGLTKAGIVFQINNGEPYTLALQEQESLAGDQSQSNRRRTSIEKVLPLEHFGLTQKDSVTYYAFAEDNAPDSPNRFETDLRFIDIRPFRRRYRMARGVGGGGGGGEGPQVAPLEELISRERYALNRTLRIDRSFQAGRRVELFDVDNLIQVQQETAELTRELADQVAQLENEEGIAEERVSDLLFAADEAMMAAMDSLLTGDYEVAALQEQDAIRYLIETRNAIEILIGGAGGGAVTRFFQANRRLLQKLRRSKTEAERADEAVRTFRALADREDDVSRALLEPSLNAADGEAANRIRLREIQQQQMDIRRDAETVNDVVQEIEGITDLLRRRLVKGVELTTKIVDALESVQVEQAAADAESVAALFRELAAQLEAVAAGELARRVAAARDLSSDFATDMRRFGDQLLQRLPDDESPAEPDVSTKPEDLASEAVRLADRLDTIADVMQSIEDAFGAEQSDATIRIARLKSEYDLAGEIELLMRIEQQIISSLWQEATAATSGVADQVDVLSQRLDAVHRALVAPRLEQLLALERRASELFAELSELPSESAVTRWHEKVEALLDDIAAAELQFDSITALRGAMDAAGWHGTPPERWDWPLGPNADALGAPEPYVASLEALVMELQSYIRMLTLAGVDAADADAVPPQYIDFVRRYLEALSQGVAD